MYVLLVSILYVIPHTCTLFDAANEDDLGLPEGGVVMRS